MSKRRPGTKPKPRAQWRFELSYHLVMIASNPETPAELLRLIEQIFPAIAGRVMRSAACLLKRPQNGGVS